VTWRSARIRARPNASTRAWVAQNPGSLPPIVGRNASASGTDVVGYLSENPGFSAFVLDDGVVYQTYQTGWRGVEFLMGYYPILDRAPNGRDEDDGFQLWIRRHDEYAPKRTGAATNDAC